MKKFLSLLLAGVMSAMLLAGCGTTANDPDPASSSTPPAGAEERSITIAQSANFSMGFARSLLISHPPNADGVLEKRTIIT